MIERLERFERFPTGKSFKRVSMTKVTGYLVSGTPGGRVFLS
jgi:hypothetical protein